jgi:hypothetical protein
MTTPTQRKLLVESSRVWALPLRVDVRGMPCPLTKGPSTDNCQFKDTTIYPATLKARLSRNGISILLYIHASEYIHEAINLHPSECDLW